MRSRFPRLLFHLLLERPLSKVILGVHLRGGERIPLSGPAILVANHNSHLDALLLASLFPISRVPRVRAVAAADYFCRNRLLRWASSAFLGIIPISRQARGGANPFAECSEALARGEILLVFPEGTRGDPEIMAPLKRGVALLSASAPEAPVIPVFLRGLGKSLPKGEGILVPFICDAWIGEPLRSSERLLPEIERSFRNLERSAGPLEWD